MNQTPVTWYARRSLMERFPAGELVFAFVCGVFGFGAYCAFSFAQAVTGAISGALS